MHIISNKQMSDVIRYIEIMLALMTGNDTRTADTKRLANKLLRKLRAKQTLSKSDEKKNAK
jgi:Asp-tRNA(Asn)/Glu-tRNA(Gln) amidotransferase C subunit